MSDSYKISVPVENGIANKYKEKTLRDLKRFGAERVYFCLGTYETDPVSRREALDILSDNVSYFGANGLETCAWFWTFLFPDDTPFTNMRSIIGEEFKKTACPLDEDFIAFSKEYVKDILSTGVDMLILDDDFRYGFLGSQPACLCDLHLAKIREIVGEDVDREFMERSILSGPGNKYRDAYLKANGDAFRNFAKEIRKTVDENAPGTRAGLCSCLTGWDIDGVTPDELSRILAGGTKPLLRLIGAPYWAALNNWVHSLQDTVEMERMERSWIKGNDIEILAEGDCYPRPRTICPASYLECFDLAIRASGCTGGIIKYGFDGYSDPDYEQGYVRFHEKNAPAREWIANAFKGKRPRGVFVYEAPKKVSSLVLPDDANRAFEIEKLVFSHASRALAYNSIPTVFEGDGGCTAVFGENARSVPLDSLNKGAIIDISAALILASRGIDCGIKNVGQEYVKGFKEIFNCNSIHFDSLAVFDVDTDAKAETVSYVNCDARKIPVTVRYENPSGQRFLIFNIDPYRSSLNAYRHYERSRCMNDAFEWISGGKLPAYVYGCPALYIIAAEDEEGLSVALFNFHADPAFDVAVRLDSCYRDAEFFGCSGTLEEDSVRLTTAVPSFSFAGISLKNR